MNLKKGKTESMLFGTTKQLSKVTKDLEVTFRGTIINNVKQYKYLGNIDNNSTFLKIFDTKYKKASQRLRLSEKMTPFLNDIAISKVYEMMIIPVLTYCGTLNLHHKNTQFSKN